MKDPEQHREEAEVAPLRARELKSDFTSWTTADEMSRPYGRVS